MRIDKTYMDINRSEDYFIRHLQIFMKTNSDIFNNDVFQSFTNLCVDFRELRSENDNLIPNV